MFGDLHKSLIKDVRRIFSPSFLFNLILDIAIQLQYIVIHVIIYTSI